MNSNEINKNSMLPNSKDRNPDSFYERFIQNAIRYFPVFIASSALGLSVIYAITYWGLFGQPRWQISVLLGINILFATFGFYLRTQISTKSPVYSTAIFLFAFFIYLFSLLLFWNISIFLYPLAILLPLFIASQNMPRRIWFIPVLFSIGGIFGIRIINALQPFERIEFASQFTVTGLSLWLASLIVWIAILALINPGRFHRLSSRLLVSYLIIAMLPALVTTTINGLMSYEHDTEHINRQLETVADLKETQISLLLEPLQSDLNNILLDQVVLRRIQFILQSPDVTPLYLTNVDQVSARLRRLTGQEGKYLEIFLMDRKGTVLVSSHSSHQGRSYASQDFFRRAELTRYVGPLVNLADDAVLFGPTSIIATQPVFTTGGQPIGIAAIRTDFKPIEQLILAKSGSGLSQEIYLVSENLKIITPTKFPVTVLQTKATINAVTWRSSGLETYRNYANQNVLGHYRWLPKYHIALVSEIDFSQAIADTLRFILTNVIIGLFTLGIALTAVFVTARSITQPITQLADSAKLVSAGDLSIRSSTDRKDELGLLSNSFNQMASDLQSLITNLEGRVEERTQALEAQAIRLKVAAEVARDAATATNLEDLLTHSVMLIRERFGFYHAGLFLIDQQRQYAVLHAATGEAGRLMLENNHKLKVGDGIVGHVADSGEPRIVLDTGSDFIHFRNPLLPYTKSEMGLPLIVNNRVIGVLDVQSDQSNAFTNEDVSTLQIMADQMAVAIERTRLFQEARFNLTELERAYASFTAQSWQVLAQKSGNKLGYHFDGLKLTDIQDIPAEGQESLQNGETIVIPSNGSGKNSTTLAVPISIRGHVIGALQLRFHGENLSKDIISMVEEVANRLALAMENTRLLEDAQKRAAKERILSDISTKISTSISMDNILKTAVEELGRVIPNSDVVIQFKKDQD